MGDHYHATIEHVLLYGRHRRRLQRMGAPVDHHAQAGTCPMCGQALPVASSEPPSTAEETV